MARKLTVTDVCAVTGYSRDELHALLRVLPPYSQERLAPRVAREFSAKDLLVLSVTRLLEDRYGVRRTALGGIGLQLHEVLGEPRLHGDGQHLALTINPPSVWIAELSERTDGVMLALAPLYEKMDAYLSYDQQLSLQFGPTGMRKYG